MTDCPFISTDEYRLAQPHRPNPLMLSDPADRTKPANQRQHGLNPGQTLSRNAKTATFSLNNSASDAVTDPTDSTLSP